MAVTSTDLTIEHYLRPDVKEIITKFATPGNGAWRCLNGDFAWWYASVDNDRRLLNAVMDYEAITKKCRVLYQSLNVFDKSLFMEFRDREEITPDSPLGTPADTEAYTLGVDIDKGPGCDIEEPETKLAVEAAAQFLVDDLSKNGVHDSVWVLFSGGGIYVQTHHGLCMPKTVEGRPEFFEMATDCFNAYILSISEEFFKAHPAHVGKVKFDALNNAKRIFKSILSIHKKKPYAVTPLNRDAIKIDFDRARVPLKDDMLAEARAWYSAFNPAEREPLLRLLDRFRALTTAARKSRPWGDGGNDNNTDIWVSPVRVDTIYFPPCITHIIENANAGEGKTRFAAVLSAFLYQMGWGEDAAWNVVNIISYRNGLENAEHIFNSCFGRINCPGCHKIQNDGAGYPHLGLKGLGCCQPEEECYKWPGHYAVAYALGEMREKENREGPKAEGPTILDAIDLLMKHEAEILGNPAFDRWGWCRLKDQFKWTTKTGLPSTKQEDEMHKALKEFQNPLGGLGMSYEYLYPIPRKEKSKKEEFGWRIKANAWKILRTGDPIQYLTDSCGRVVLGADTAFKKLACCVSAQNVNQTAGMHPKLSGESSGGKTITVYSFAHHLPREMVIKGSMSAKSGFYHSDGDRVVRILDDYQAGNEDLDTTIKQTSSEFHQPYIHRTVANHMPVTLTIGKEQMWCITSVDSSQDIQVLNRQLPINVNDSIELTKQVNDKTVERYAKGGLQQPVDKPVLVSRAIFQILRDQGYINVRIPFGDRIEWLDTSNRRNPSIFMDLLISTAAMNRYQREQDSEGYYLATEADFQTARALFNDKDAEELVKRLTARERDLINLLITNSGGLTRDDLAEKMGVAPQRITQLLNGQKGYGGLSQKVQIREEKKSVSVRTGNKETDDTRHTVFKTIYSLQEYDRFAGFDAVVRLNPSKPTPEDPGKQGKHEVSKEVSNQTITSKEEVSKVSKEEKEREREEREGLPRACKDFSREKEKNAYLLTSEAQHTESQCLPAAYQCLPCLPPDGAPNESPPTMGPHPRKDEPSPTKKPEPEPVICAKCGADLTGHSQFENGGKVYCAKPGCGYPARGQSEVPA